jgi:hypothetical protein
MGTSCLRYNWTTLSLEDITTETWSCRFGVGHRADDHLVTKSKELKTGCNQAEFSNEGSDSKMVVLPIIMTMNDRVRQYKIILQLHE